MVDLDKLEGAERRVRDAFPAGTLVDMTAGNKADDDPAGGQHWGTDRQVRADVLLALLCGAVVLVPGQVGEVRIRGARVTGKINCPGAEFRHRLLLDRCSVEDGIDLSEAATRSLGLIGCHVGPINLTGAKISGGLDLSGAGFRADSGIQLTGASVGGQLIFSGAHLDGKSGSRPVC